MKGQRDIDKGCDGLHVSGLLRVHRKVPLAGLVFWVPLENVKLCGCIDFSFWNGGKVFIERDGEGERGGEVQWGIGPGGLLVVVGEGRSAQRRRSP